MSQPLITVIIPAYNNASYLTRCLDSCLSQTLKEIEILVVDDGSSDGTPGLLEDYRKKDLRIHVIRTRNNGVVAARKQGVTAATGQYLFFLDSDDELLPDALSLLLREAVRTGADIVTGGFIRIFPGGRQIERMLPVQGKVSKPAFVTALFQECSFYLWGRLYRKTAFTAGSWDLPPSMILGEDMAILSRLVDRAESVAVISVPVYRYYYREESVSAGRETEEKVLSLYEASRFAEKLLKPYCADKAGQLALACFIADQVYKYFLSDCPFSLYREDVKRRLAEYWRPEVKAEVMRRNIKIRILLDIAFRYPRLAKKICGLYSYRRYKRI